MGTDEASKQPFLLFWFDLIVLKWPNQPLVTVLLLEKLVINGFSKQIGCEGNTKAFLLAIRIYYDKHPASPKNQGKGPRRTRYETEYTHTRQGACVQQCAFMRRKTRKKLFQRRQCLYVFTRCPPEASSAQPTTPRSCPSKNSPGGPPHSDGVAVCRHHGETDGVV